MSPHRRESDPEPVPQNLDLELGGVRVTSITFTIAFYTQTPFTEAPAAVLQAYRRYRGLCPEESLRFYATESMRQHKPVTKRTFGMLETWLKPGAPPREYVALELHDGEDYRAAPRFKFHVLGAERGSVAAVSGMANLLGLAFPASWALERRDELVSLAREVAAALPYRVGYAGYSFHWSRYAQEQSLTHAWAKSMRHPGADIYHPVKDRDVVGSGGLKAGAWLTFLSWDRLDLLGGKERIRDEFAGEIGVSEVGDGILLQAGPFPRFGDTNRRDVPYAYRQVARVLSPMIEAADEHYGSLTLPSDKADRTRAWLRRFSDGG